MRNQVLSLFAALTLCTALVVSSAQGATVRFQDPVQGYFYSPEEGEPGTRILLPLPDDTKEYTFLYWVDQNTGKLYLGGRVFEIYDDTVLTAYWDAVKPEEPTEAEEQQAEQEEPTEAEEQQAEQEEPTELPRQQEGIDPAPRRPLELPQAGEAASFADVEREAWYADSVAYVTRLGLMSGTGGDRFDPETPFSRAMTAQLLYNLEGKPQAPGAGRFPDVGEGDWYAPAVNWCAQVGLLSGMQDGSFAPQTQVSRQDFATALYHYAQYRGYGFFGQWYFLLNYPDAEELSSYADEPMHWMVMHGIMNGMDGRLSPRSHTTRAQVASMLERFAQVLSE